MSRTELAPDSPVLADTAAGWAATYVHIPFCARVCPYCDFAVVAGQDELADRYLACLRSEIASAPAWRPLDAVYVGGGTPSRFGARRLGAVLAALSDRFGIESAAEVGLEANPEDWTAALSSGLRQAGFNRVSFGAQSFRREVLDYLGRMHTPAAIGEAVTDARKTGFRSVNLDLIFGSPVEGLHGWRETVERAIELEPDHVSCYALTVEPGTPLSRAVAAGAAGPDADFQADAYELADELLAVAGMVRYEVSNWARTGHACRYNLGVWAQGEYEAFGNGAHGFRDGVRFRNVRRLDAYLDRVEQGGQWRAGSEMVGGWAGELDRLFVGLRRTAGVSDGPGVRALLASGAGRRLLEAGVIEAAGERLRVVRPLLTDAVERAVLALPPPES